MANTDAPKGAKAVSHLTGGDHTRLKAYPIAAAYSTTIYSGDLVKLVAGGGIELAAAGERALGVFSGARWVDSEGNQQFNRRWTGPSSATDIEALVVDDPNVIFEIQADGTVAAADVGQLADMISTHAGNDSTGQSGQELNSTTGTGTATFRILGKAERPDNDWGANVDLLVQIFEHEFAYHGQATPGV